MVQPLRASPVMTSLRFCSNKDAGPGKNSPVALQGQLPASSVGGQAQVDCYRLAWHRSPSHRDALDMSEGMNGETVHRLLKMLRGCRSDKTEPTQQVLHRRSACPSSIQDGNGPTVARPVVRKSAEKFEPQSHPLAARPRQQQQRHGCLSQKYHEPVRQSGP